MKTVTLRSLLLLAFLALPASPLTGQTEAQLREIREQEAKAREQIEEQLFRVQEAHAVAAERAHEHVLQLALEEVQQHQEHMAQEQHQALRIALEHEHQARGQELQERQRTLVRIREGQRDRARDLRQVVVRLQSRARLGVSLDPRQGKEYDQQGVLVTDVHDDSPAEGAGLQEGDIITHLNGQSLLEPMGDEEEVELDEYQSLPVQRLMALVKELEDEEAAEVRYLRDGAQASASMVPAERSENWISGMAEGHIDELKIEFEDMDLEDFEFEGGRNFRFRSSPNMAFFGPEGTWSTPEGTAQFEVLRGDNNAWSFYSQNHAHGLELRELNPDLGSYFSTETGVLVMSVDEDSTLGLTAGDVILRIGDREVEDIRDFHRILGSYEDDESFTLTIMRNGQETTVEGTAR